MDVHIVRKGDTLWKISRQYGVSFEELKRVNAHLANPDYIVPGMKIFLPERAHRKGESKTPSTGHVKKIEKVEKAPVPKQVAPAERVEVEKKPVPVPAAPKAPKVTVKPIEEVKPAPPPKVEKPVAPKVKKPAPAPKPPKVEVAPPSPPPKMEMPAPPVQPQMPPMTQMQSQSFFIGVPCGWLPIFDADCHPHVHPAQMQPMPMPMPMPHPMAPPMSQLPVHESPNIPHPQARPSEKPAPPKVEKKMESPIFPPIKPKIEESPFIQTEPIQNIPAYESPMFEAPVREMPMLTPMPFDHCTCGQPVCQCGGRGGHHPSWAGDSMCGCGGYEPMPIHQHHMNHHPFCNACNQPIGHHRFPVMPFPIPYYWHGMY